MSSRVACFRVAWSRALQAAAAVLFTTSLSWNAIPARVVMAVHRSSISLPRSRHWVITWDTQLRVRLWLRSESGLGLGFDAVVAGF